MKNEASSFIWTVLTQWCCQCKRAPAEQHSVVQQGSWTWLKFAGSQHGVFSVPANRIHAGSYSWYMNLLCELWISAVYQETVAMKDKMIAAVLPVSWCNKPLCSLESFPQTQLSGLLFDCLHSIWSNTQPSTQVSARFQSQGCCMCCSNTLAQNLRCSVAPPQPPSVNPPALWMQPLSYNCKSVSF